MAFGVIFFFFSALSHHSCVCAEGERGARVCRPTRGCVATSSFMPAPLSRPQQLWFRVGFLLFLTPSHIYLIVPCALC